MADVGVSSDGDGLTWFWLVVVFGLFCLPSIPYFEQQIYVLCEVPAPCLFVLQRSRHCTNIITLTSSNTIQSKHIHPQMQLSNNNHAFTTVTFTVAIITITILTLRTTPAPSSSLRDANKRRCRVSTLSGSLHEDPCFFPGVDFPCVDSEDDVEHSELVRVRDLT